MARFDICVIGLGAMGSAAAFQAADRGASVLGIDRYTPPHASGSTHGESRITRQAIGEGDAYVPLVLRSNEIWRDIEAKTGSDLLTQCGGLIMGPRDCPRGQHGVTDFVQSTINTAENYCIDHEVLSAPDAMLRFPQFRLAGDEAVYYEPGAGFLRPERCVEAQLHLAQDAGAVLRTGETVHGFTESATSVLVTTDTAIHEADQVILAAGPWMSQLVDPELSALFEVYRQVLYWFPVLDDSQMFDPTNCPVFIWETPSDDGQWGLYGFPAFNGPSGGVKVATRNTKVVQRLTSLILKSVKTRSSRCSDGTSNPTWSALVPTA